MLGEGREAMEVGFVQQEFAEEVRKRNPSPETSLSPCQGSSWGFAGAQTYQSALRFGEIGLSPYYPAKLIANSCKGHAWPVSFPSLMIRGDKCWMFP